MELTEIKHDSIDEEQQIEEMKKLLKENEQLQNDLGETYKNTLQMNKNDIKSMEQLKEVLHEVGYKRLSSLATTKENGQIQIPKSQHYMIAGAIHQYSHVILIGEDIDNARLYIYNYETGLYEGSKQLLSSLVLAYDFRANSRQQKEVYEYLRTISPLKETMSDRYRIPVKNGIYDLKKKELLSFNPDYIITNKIDTSFNPNATNPNIEFKGKTFNVDEWICSIANNDEEVNTLLWQVMNEAINPNYTRGHTAFLYGSGNNGKGTYQQLLINLIGIDKVASLQPTDFSEQFTPYSLLGKVVNIRDDVPTTRLKAPNMLKSISTGDTVLLNEKYGGSYSVNLKLFCMFSCNEIPTANDSTDGWYRRLLLIPFNANFSGQVENKKIKEAYIEDQRVLEYVLKKVLELDFEDFIQPKIVKNALHEYKKKNDYIEQFLYDVYLPNNLHEEDKVPHDFIKRGINDLQREHGASERLPYGYTKKFVKRLEEATGYKYNVNIAQRYPISERDSAPEILKHYYNDYNQVLKSLIRREL